MSAQDRGRLLVKHVINQIASLYKIMGMEVDNNDIYELVEEHSQEVTTEELMELHCVSQPEVVEESLSEEERPPISRDIENKTVRESLSLKNWIDFANLFRLFTSIPKGYQY
ncbi:hypothetical protein AVEN_21748-1 [Araneus ventricosus]|uniref:Uncharacterized protein n=1 Tax=Araneus ventricosus TaxID=182803 RepID=A0A4Y2EVJ9_ARAVE|nr:hypothetical protein AVEN_21748-1 [Araneus ventricosus]